jgi:N-acetylglucosaminyldiphosphoundecaprenol N-acetyl-beta-D-mannosaminyltransferase
MLQMTSPPISPPQMPPLPPRVTLHGVAFDAATETELVRHVFDACEAGRGGWIITANLDILRRAVRDEEFAGMAKEADVVTADGMPLVWASRLQGTPLPERVAGSAMVWSLAAEAARRGRSLYLLGGMPGAAEGAADVLTQRYLGLKIVGMHCPPMGFEHDPAAITRIERDLADTRPDLVYVALGSPKQEQLIRRLRAAGLLPAAWWVGVGISLSFICGQVQRAPRWMQVLGLEWMHRLVQEPGRLAKRYLVHGLPFAASLLLRSAFARLRRH